MIIKEQQVRTSAQIALEDETFKELFGMIWENNNYFIKTKEDLSWTIFYKDIFMQAVSDYVNKGFNKINIDQSFLIYESAEQWIKKDSPFNNIKEVELLKAKINNAIEKFKFKKTSKIEKKRFTCKLHNVLKNIDKEDPFEFKECCKVLGLNIEAVRIKLDIYRNLKLKYKNKIRIVNYTGTKKGLDIPSLSDIVESEINGQHDPSLFLHVGIGRGKRNQAIVRSRNER